MAQPEQIYTPDDEYERDSTIIENFLRNMYNYAIVAIKKHGLDRALLAVLNYDNQLNATFEANRVDYRAPSTAGFDDTDDTAVKEHSGKMVSALERLVAGPRRG
jgi:hypothetical protein